MESVAVPAIKRANPDTTKTLSRAGVLTVYEAQGRMGLMKPQMGPFMLAAPAMLPINSKWNFRSSHAPFQNKRSKIQPRDDYLQKTGEPMRRRYFVAVCQREHAARWQYDFTEAEDDPR